jgi:sulfatase maturation enzyme AslB (radical SAM superfamily)
MSFDKKFCPSPWFHTRINNTGNYEYCRWASRPKNREQNTSIADTSPIEWFQKHMAPVRRSFLEGQAPEECFECDLQDQYKKVSGRQRQLLKIGVSQDNFQKSFLSSPWIQPFVYSLNHDGQTDQLPQDWQIDLGNYCNSACVFCTPHSSSRLAAEFKRIGFINQLPSNSWCDDPVKLKTFIDTIKQTPKLAYLHFIGGETLITPAFRVILEALIEQQSTDISIGFTTNLTVWDQEIVDLLVQFKEVNLGMSIECIHPLNDYVRYGSSLSTVTSLMSRWLKLADDNHWPAQLRITPTALSIWHLDTIYEYALIKGVSVESCNFLTNPEFMKPSVLPMSYRDKIIEKLENRISLQNSNDSTQIVNVRNSNTYQKQIVQDAQSYINYLKEQPIETHLLPDLVSYIKKLEKSRNNCLLDYLPEYETLFRSAGY